MEIEKALNALASRALKEALGVDAAPNLRPTADPTHGDYQVNAALALAKQLGRKPRDLAEPIAAWLREQPEIAGAEVAGPGFVNLRISASWLASLLTADAADTLHEGIPQAAVPRHIVIDFSSPNIAKQMHVGHLRSTIIGQALVRLFRETGHKVTSVNHIGDWGTQYGLLLVGMTEFGDPKALEDAPVAELERIYKLASARAKEDEAFAERARAELAKLQNGDPKNRELWAKFVATTRVELDAAYERLGITFDSWRGESAYNDALPGVVDLLKKRGLAKDDQGAVGIFWKEVAGAPPNLQKKDEPFLVQKRDGAFLYSTTDIAALLYRNEELKADEILYVVDERQRDHFDQLFAVSELLGQKAKLAHVSFGTILDESGKPLKTRDGKAVTLKSLLDEAEARAEARIEEGVQEGKLRFEDSERAMIRRSIGIGAVKYADLRQNRRSDYQFDWGKMVSFQGNAGPYLQYAHARVMAIFAKGQESLANARGPITLGEPEAFALGRCLSRFGETVALAAETYQPHLLTDYLYDLARAFMAFYEGCPILKAEGAARQSRLALAALTARQMRRGLLMLGIDAPERM